MEFVGVVVIASVFGTSFIQIELPNVIGLVEVLLIQINGLSFFELLILLNLLLSGRRKRHLLSRILVILLADESAEWACDRVSQLLI